MAVYDKAAKLYSEVFTDIRLRCFEWPWLKKIILKLKPDTLLDLGCGNGYLLSALENDVPNLYGVEPSGPMFRIAKERAGRAIIYNASAEALPFQNEMFDMVISLLSFRYMDWEKSLAETHRVLRPAGTFVIIDLFDAPFDFLKIGTYFAVWLKTRLQYARNPEYRRKLRELSQDVEWQNMVKQNPKRELDEARRVIEKRFAVKTEKILCQSVRGRTAGFVCEKK